MTTSADRAAMARVLTRDFVRAAKSEREIKRAPLALGEVSAAGTFEGYASLFGVADLGRDVVERGAFAASLRKRAAADIKMLWQHDPGEPLGAWVSIAEDSVGLKVKGRLNLAVARAREILALMREGQIDGLSIGFRTQRAMQDRKTGLRRLQQLDLWEISLVTFPMLPQARVTAVKRVGSSAESVRVATSLDCVAAKFARARWGESACRVEAKLMGIAQRLERRCSPNQPRDELGQWAGAESDAGELLAGLVIRICVAMGIARSVDEFGNQSYTVEYECRDGRTITKRGAGKPPGLIPDPVE